MSGAERIPAVILAGGTLPPELAAAFGESNRALVRIEGETMLDRVVRALAGAGIRDIVVSGDVPPSTRYRQIRDAGGFVENLFAGLRALPAADRVLITTVDVPFLTSEAVRDLLERGAAIDADLVYPVVRVEDCYRRFPGIRRTAVRLREGAFTGGNLVLARPGFVLEREDLLRRAYQKRKKPAAIARMLGAGTIARFAAGMLFPALLAIIHVEAAAGRLIGGRARALISSYPELATDIDRPEDLAAIRDLRTLPET